jgi:hypothetical protein
MLCLSIFVDMVSLNDLFVVMCCDFMYYDCYFSRHYICATLCCEFLYYITTGICAVILVLLLLQILITLYFSYTNSDTDTALPIGADGLPGTRNDAVDAAADDKLRGQVHRQGFSGPESHYGGQVQRLMSSYMCLYVL